MSQHPEQPDWRTVSGVLACPLVACCCCFCRLPITLPPLVAYLGGLCWGRRTGVLALVITILAELIIFVALWLVFLRCTTKNGPEPRTPGTPKPTPRFRITQPSLR